MVDLVVPVILGGTSFMGKHLRTLLDQQGEVFFLLNRGTSYWRETQGDMQCPNTCTRGIHIPMDREEDASVLAAMRKLHDALRADSDVGNSSEDSQLTSHHKPFGIVDFSCDDEFFMRRVWDAMACCGLTPSLYILISTDSVYEEARVINQRVVESSPCIYNRRKGYGGEKLRGENALLQRLASETAVGVKALAPYYIFRLPDVLGPYDNTGRYWASVLWAMSNAPLLLTDSAAKLTMSLVYGPDVAVLCQRLLVACSSSSPPPRSGVYNLACTEVITMKDMLDSITKRLGVTPSRVFSTTKALDSDASSSSSSSGTDSDDGSAVSCDYYPSVTCGPLNVDSATLHLGWLPTPLCDALTYSTDFFSQRARNGPEYRKAFAKLPLMVRASLNSHE